MIDDRNVSKHPTEALEFNLSMPRFDEKAAANAQPVQPLPVSRVSALAASVRHGVTSGSRALVLVVIAGLATGTLAGMAWVKGPQVIDASTTASQPVSELAPNNSLNEEPRAEVFGVADLQSTMPMTARIRRSRPRIRPNRGTRAYRVAVLH